MLIIVSVIFITIDTYAFRAIKRLTSNKIIWFVYWATTFVVLLNALLVMRNFSYYEGTTLSTLKASGWLSVIYLPKLIMVTIMFGEDIFRLIYTGIDFVFKKLLLKSDEEKFMPQRRKFISKMAIGLASIQFGAVAYGIVKGKFNFKVFKENVFFDDLPTEFDGFTITQISDVHIGSFQDKKEIAKAIEMINELQSDIVVFTGDLVNNKSTEMDGWIDCFSKIKAKHGKYSVLGNHDYGDYVKWHSEEEKENNMKQMYNVHESIGFELLNNQNKMFTRNNKSISLIGVENWGLKFKQRGDVDLAMQGIDENDFKVLLSHDPSYWDEVIKTHKNKIHLTLSGHTHGMQYGIEVPGISWSPIQYIYKHWAGLFKEHNRYLYVNRGFGFHAFPGRVGIWPEITKITLRKT